MIKHDTGDRRGRRSGADVTALGGIAIRQQRVLRARGQQASSSSRQQRRCAGQRRRRGRTQPISPPRPEPMRPRRRPRKHGARCGCRKRYYQIVPQDVRRGNKCCRRRGGTVSESLREEALPRGKPPERPAGLFFAPYETGGATRCASPPGINESGRSRPGVRRRGSRARRHRRATCAAWRAAARRASARTRTQPCPIPNSASAHAEKRSQRNDTTHRPAADGGSSERRAQAARHEEDERRLRRAGRNVDEDGDHLAGRIRREACHEKAGLPAFSLVLIFGLGLDLGLRLAPPAERSGDAR